MLALWNVCSERQVVALSVQCQSNDKEKKRVRKKSRMEDSDDVGSVKVLVVAW